MGGNRLCMPRGPITRGCAVATLLWLMLSPLQTAAQSSRASGTFARHKTGPVSIRGIAFGIHKGGFSLKTTKYGALAVSTRALTQVVEKGKQGNAVVSDGDHVRVRGFLTGRVLTAMKVQIIPVKQKVKPFSVRGDVRSTSRSRLVLSAGSTSLSVALNSGTVVDGAATSLSGLRSGDRVLVRLEKLGPTPVAVHIHVYKREPTGHRVQLHGIVAGVVAGGLAVAVGSHRYRVVVTGGTKFLQGISSASRRDLKAGMTVTVYACCQGGDLTASSIHILKTRVHRTVSTIHGTVIALSRNQMSIKTSSTGTIVVEVAASTPVAVGSSPASSRNVRLGDEVSVRASKVGATWRASRVRVYARSRKVRTLVGKVVSVSKSTIVLDERGTRYTVTVNGSTVVSSGARKTYLNYLHAGDRVTVSGEGSGTGLIAARVQVTPAKVKPLTVRGVIQSVTTSGIELSDSNGAKYMVRPGPGVKVLYRGKPAPPGAIFPGVKIRARGQVSGRTIVASSVTITLQSRTVSGRVARVAPGAIMLSSSRSAIWTLDLAGNPPILDGTKSIRASVLGAGADVRARGYLARIDRLRALRIDVLHPSVTLSGTVISTSGNLRIQTASGQRYTLHLSSSSSVSAERTVLSVTVADIPVGARVKIQGTVGTDGTVKVESLAVRLASYSARGQVLSISARELRLTTAAGAVAIKIESATTVLQGTHPIKLGDVVIGDDLTVYGYRGVAVLARKLLVHRKRVSAGGSVAALTPNGFTLTAADGSHQVVMSGATVVVSPTSQTVAVGDVVRVSGYLRGDGTILATRITIKKAA